MLDLISNDLETLVIGVLWFIMAMAVVSNWANENKQKQNKAADGDNPSAAF